MKMMGIGGCARASRRCSSSPLKPGRRTSRMRHDGLSLRSRCRNSVEEAKHSTRRDTEVIRFANASRIEASSSTTNTIGSTDFTYCRPLARAMCDGHAKSTVQNLACVGGGGVNSSLVGSGYNFKLVIGPGSYGYLLRPDHAFLRQGP